MNWRCAAAGVAVSLVLGCAPEGGRGPAGSAGSTAGPQPLTRAERVVEAARDEVRRGVVYDASYFLLSYPGGDVPADRGACTDVVIRALRAIGHDLQRLVHEDVRRRPRAYPRVRRPDRSIDHRRCSNLVPFLRRHGRTLPVTRDPADWRPGDLVFLNLPGGLAHTGVCSDRRGPTGLPLLIHNAGRAAEEDALGRWDLTGHFRYPADL